MRIGVECGLRWYHLHNWYCRDPWHKRCATKNLKLFRWIADGFAVGPIMVIRGKW